MSTSLGFVAIARPTFDVALAQDMTAQVRQQLANAGYTLLGPDALVMSAEDVESAVELLAAGKPALLLVLQASFADSTMALRLAEAVDAPILLWALPEARVGGRLRLNSFCGINLAGHSLRRADRFYDYVYAPPGDPGALAKLDRMSHAAKVRRRLQGTRIGRIGEHPAGFPTCTVNYVGLREKLGIEIEQIELTEVFDGARSADPQAITALRRLVEAKVAGVAELDRQATDRTLGTCDTLQRMALSRQISGFAVRCWPEFFTDLGCAACGALSMLSNDLIPCSCEADVNGTITQLILQWVGNAPAFGTDVVAFDTEQDVTIVWHCGLAPLDMADPAVQPRATIHSNRKLPLLMEFTLKPGRVTLARLSEATGEFRLVIGGGEMIQAPPSFGGTSGTLRFDSGAQRVMDTIMREGLEHHISFTYGDHVETLEVLAAMLRLPTLRL